MHARPRLRDGCGYHVAATIIMAREAWLNEGEAYGPSSISEVICRVDDSQSAATSADITLGNCLSLIRTRAIHLRRGTCAPPADQESAALCCSIFLIDAGFGLQTAAEKILPQRARNITGAEGRSAKTRM